MSEPSVEDGWTDVGWIVVTVTKDSAGHGKINVFGPVMDREEATIRASMLSEALRDDDPPGIALARPIEVHKEGSEWRWP